MALVRLACAAVIALASCRASEAGPGSGLSVPAGWKSLPSLANAARDAAKTSGFVVDNADAWGETARGCYGASLELATKLAKPAKLADELVQGIQSEPALAGITVTDVVKPAPTATTDVLSLGFERAPYRGKLRARLANNGHISLLVCFWNQREPTACEAACDLLLGELTVKRALTIASVLAAGGIAWADRAPLVTPPAGWKQDPQQATALAAKANEVSHFGGLRSLATADVYIAPAGGAALIVTAVAGKVVPADRDVAARFALDELRDAVGRAELAGSGVTSDGGMFGRVSDEKLVRGIMQWTDTSTGTHTYALVKVAADDENIVAITGECVSSGADAAADAACRAALDTLDPGIPLASRQPIGIAPPGAVLTLPAPPTTPSQIGPATMTDGTHTPLPPMTVPTEKPAKDRRPVYVGLGIVLLAAAFWWNQRRRASFEKDSDE